MRRETDDGWTEWTEWTSADMPPECLFWWRSSVKLEATRFLHPSTASTSSSLCHPPCGLLEQPRIPQLPSSRISRQSETVFIPVGEDAVPGSCEDCTSSQPSPIRLSSSATMPRAPTTFYRARRRFLAGSSTLISPSSCFSSRSFRFL